MKVFVTGGAGYVGSHCVRALCAAEHEVVVFDDLRSGHREAVDGRASLVVADLLDPGALDAALDAGFDAVMHFAGSIDVGESVAEPLLYYQNNVGGSLALLEGMRRREIRSIVFSSTCATYGMPARVPIAEDCPQQPISPYGRSKLAVEWALRDSATAWGLGSTSLRYFNAAGASSDGTIGEAHAPESHLIPLVLQVALGTRAQIKLFGTDYPTRDGTCVRDYVHVEDLASAHVAALERQVTGEARAFNLGVGRGATVKEIVACARKVTGHAIPAVEDERRPGDPPELLADPALARGQLDWRPRHTEIGAIVASAWRWHSAHPRGFAG